ncbi:hypothetical protein [Streptomyces sp. NPDC091268]|uniref:hypothetical protein n=1 Tax=Streptomyces sp. NPDC091268 TaxID=3365979 RepID=UPI003807693C
MSEQQDSPAPRPWGDPRESVRENRSTVRLLFAVAVVLFAIAAYTDWPTDRAEVCGRLSALQAAHGSIEDEIRALQSAAEDYRGAQRDAVRSDAARIDDDLLGGSGWKWLGREDIDHATGSIRALCATGPAGARAGASTP